MNSFLARLSGVTALVAAAALPAVALPNIQSAVETGGDADREPAKYTGLTFDIMNGTTLVTAGYTVGRFGEDAKAMTDRAHDYGASSATVSLPSYLVGQEYIMIANNNRDNATYSLQVTIAQPSLVYLLIDNRLGDGDAATPPDFTANMKWVQTDLYVPFASNGNHVGNPAFPDDVGIDESADGTINNWSSVYAKVVPAGTFTLGAPDNASRNMYGVVVAAIPEPGTAGLLLLGAGVLGCARRSRR